MCHRVCLALLFAAALTSACCNEEDAMMQASNFGLPPVGRDISVVAWNIGYAGLGADSDFFKDLGNQKRPPAAASVDRNLAGIMGFLRGEGADALLLQEVAVPSYITYQRDVFGTLAQTLPDHSSTFERDFRTRFVPPPFNFGVGNASFLAVAGETERVVLSDYTEVYFGVARREYAVYVSRLEGEARWSLLNIHLSAFDADGDLVREKQAQDVVAIAEREYAAGRCVIIGGDWNMRLVPTDFPHATDKIYQFWIRDLPEGILPEGWRYVIDSTAPTVRTLHEPYRPGKTYRTIVDGFAVSPNVTVRSVETHDLDFAFSDHNPVVLRATASNCRP